MRNQGFALAELDRLDEAVAAQDLVVRRFGDETAPEVLVQVAYALANQADVYKRLGRIEEAIQVCDEEARRFGASSDPTLREQVASALVSKGVRLDELGRLEDELAAYEEVELRYGQPGEPGHRQLAWALSNKGLTLEHLGRDDEAVAAFEAVEREFGDDDDPDVQRQVASARFSRQLVAGELEPFRVLATVPPADPARLLDMRTGMGGLVSRLTAALPFLGSPRPEPLTREDELDPDSELRVNMQTLRGLTFTALYDLCCWLAGANQPVPDDNDAYSLTNLRAIAWPRERLGAYVNPGLLALWDEALRPYLGSGVRLAPELGDDAKLIEHGLERGEPVRAEVQFKDRSSLLLQGGELRPVAPGDWMLTLWVSADLARIDDAMLRPDPGGDAT
jgi:tetratricopeptide (TPR) repeat protein